MESKRRTDAAAYSYRKVADMGRYFGREPRYSRDELERQAQEAIDARISMGRPPAEDFLPVERRLAEMERAVAVRPPAEPLPESQPLRLHAVRPLGAPATSEAEVLLARTSPN
jgi:hypothetical protein